MGDTQSEPSVWSSLGALLMSTIFALLLTELVLRAFTAFPIHSASANKVSHPQLAYTINTELRGIDSSGFRNERVLETADIAAIGDSHTFGYNVSSEEAWPSQLARMSDRMVYNFGVGSYGIFIYYALMERALELEPRHVLVALYPANDIQGMCNRLKMPYWKKKARAWGVSEETIDRCTRREEDGEEGVMGRVIRWVYHTALGSALDALVWDPIKGRYAARLLDVVEIEGLGLRALIQYEKLETDAQRMDLDRSEIRELQKLSFDLFTEMAKRARKAGAELGVLIIPSKERALAQYARENGNDLPEIFHTAVERERRLVADYAQFFDEHQIPHVDVTSRLRTRIGEGNTKLYPLIDSGHPYAPGYEAYARAAYEELLESGSKASDES